VACDGLGSREFICIGELERGRVRVLWSAAVIVILIGLISEQITSLTYRRDA
jgi:hypothetical protein